jgi:predicted nucleotidyltransferase
MTSFIATIPSNQIAKFCHRWKIVELALFGSALRDDFGPASDLDILVTFAADARWGLFDHVQMEQELQRLLKRSVDLISKRALERNENWLRRQEILKSVCVFYPERTRFLQHVPATASPLLDLTTVPD